jgi:nucleotide-binding universal stress UspA family protein
MYRRALVPLDGSGIAEAILPFIREIAGPLDMEVVLIRVVSLTPEEVIGVAPKFAPDTLEGRELEARQYLEPLVKELEAHGIRASARVSVGEPAGEIVAAARQAGADLIAMTTHGRSGLSRLLFGSVAESVLRSAPIPVFLLKMTEEALTTAGSDRKARAKVDRILFATDFSDAALVAWPTARSLATAFEAELILEHVIPPLTVQGDLPPEVFSRYWEGARAEAERELAGFRAEVPGLKVRIRLDEGRAASQILRAAAEEGADLIVMGTTGRSGVRRLLLGSVAAAVVRLASRPVVTVGPLSEKERQSHVA